VTKDRAPAGLAGTVDHVDAGDGWLIVRLMTRQALRREGEHMGHCLADGNYDELRGEEEMTGNAIWSLRDPAGMSRATLDVRHRRVVMAKGKGNSDVGGKAARRLRALVAAFRAAGADLDFAGETGLVVAPNGYVCREDQAPPEVIEAVRAKHRAAVEAAREPREAMQASRRWHSRPLRAIVTYPDGTSHEIELGDVSPDVQAAMRREVCDLTIGVDAVQIETSERADRPLIVPSLSGRPVVLRSRPFG